MLFFIDLVEGVVEGIGVVCCIGWMCFVGNGLGVIFIVLIIFECYDGLLVWVLLLFNVLVWFVLVLMLIQCFVQFVFVQFCCMVVDFFFGGGWIVFMVLSVVFSVLFIVLLVVDKIVVGGVCLVMCVMLVLLLGFVLIWWMFGFFYQLVILQCMIVLSVLFLFVYGIGLSIFSWQLVCRVKLQNCQLQWFSWMDLLVELVNCGFLILCVQQVLDWVQGQGGFVCLLMFDVDDFKCINDLYGYCVGDEVLWYIVVILCIVVWFGDMFVWLGGDEFVVLLCDCVFVDVMYVVEWVCLYLFEVVWQVMLGVEFSVSIGIVVMLCGGSVEDWLVLVDCVLYYVKCQGKNIVSYGE